MGFFLALSAVMRNLELFCKFLVLGHSQTKGAAILLRLKLGQAKGVPCFVR